MRTEKVRYFTDKEKEFANLLIEIGTRKSVAKVLVFLANIPEASSRDIERGTDLRQPEVSVAMRYLTGQSWITNHDRKDEGRGRPFRMYKLSCPLHEIMNSIENEKKNEAANQIALVQKLQYFLR